MIPLSLYIHFPWCVRKCPYCDFNSHTTNTAIPEEEYIQRLLQDLEYSLPHVAGRSLQSIFMGGGTPSLFSADSIAYLLNAIHQKISFDPQIEITLEANPGTVDEKNFRGFLQAGVNRLSLGVQSFNQVHLKRLGRIHDEQDAKRAIHTAFDVGFKNINIDLMHGLPDQTMTQALHDITQAISFCPPHISWYQLTIEPNTIFYKTKPQLPVDDTLAEIQTQGEALLAKVGYVHYEVSAFAQAGQESQHNINYWQFGDYLGIGAGAHEKLSLESPRQIIRNRRARQPKDYLNPDKAIIAGSEIIAQTQLPFEFMMNAMRLNRPISRQLFETRTGLPWATLKPTLQKAVEKKLLSFDEAQITISVLGRKFLNDLLTLFL